MARDLGLDDVVDHFTLIGDELDLLHTKSGSTRLGFAALLKFLLWRGRFPRAAHELPGDAVAHLARQVRAPVSACIRSRRAIASCWATDLGLGVGADRGQLGLQLL
jgi:hypothetical protein